jgi:6,7-dimethyl-8-ribityllumazine synthase
MGEPFPALIEGYLAGLDGARLAIVSSRFNELVVDRLVEGALGAFERHGINKSLVTHVRVPGAFELSPVCMRLAKSGKFDAIIALGAVIRGATSHFDFVAGEAARGVAAASSATGLPVIFGVLTTDTLDQAFERAGSKAGNKGYEAAVTALEMVSLSRKLTDHGF